MQQEGNSTIHLSRKVHSLLLLLWSQTQYYIQLLYKPYLRPWILQFGPLGSKNFFSEMTETVLKCPTFGVDFFWCFHGQKKITFYLKHSMIHNKQLLYIKLKKNTIFCFKTQIKIQNRLPLINWILRLKQKVAS